MVQAILVLGAASVAWRFLSFHFKDAIARGKKKATGTGSRLEDPVVRAEMEKR